MWQQLDDIFAWLWHKPLAILCGFTGKSNFFFARGLNVLGGVLQILFMVYVLTISASLLVVFMAYSAIALTVLNIIQVRKNSIKLEQQYLAGKYSDVLPNNRMTANRMKPMLVYVLAVLPIALSYPALPALMASLGLTLFGGSIYWLTDFQPPKKSWVRKGIEKIGEMVSRIRLALPAPVPRPV